MTNYDVLHEEHNITRIVLHQPHTLDELKTVVADVADNHPYKLRIYDLRKFVFNLTHEEIQDISEFGKMKFDQPSRIALLVQDSLSYGVLRMFEVYRGQGNFVHVKPFWEHQEAIDWLLEEEQDMSSE